MQETPLTSAQCRAARAMIRWTLDELAQASDVGRATIARFELGDDIKLSTAAKLRAAFDPYVRFIDEGEFAGGVYPSEAG